MIRPKLALPRLLLAATLSALLTAPVEAHVPTVRILSQHALVIDEASGKSLVEKDADSVVPIASLTKLMTAMVVLDAKQSMNEEISIDPADVDALKHSRSRVPVGTTLSRRTLLHLALMSSENRAAASLARTYPGGITAFRKAVHVKTKALDMSHTVIDEPTGLSPSNTSTASDLAKMAAAAATYPAIAAITTDSGQDFEINGKTLAYHNTNSFVGKTGWGILLSKTGYTQEAGRCIIMRMQAAGRRTLVVLLNASGPQARRTDLANIKRYLSNPGSIQATTNSYSKPRARHAVSVKPIHRWVARDSQKPKKRARAH